MLAEVWLDLFLLLFLTAIAKLRLVRMKEMFFIYCRRSELAEDRSRISKNLENNLKQLLLLLNCLAVLETEVVRAVSSFEIYNRIPAQKRGELAEGWNCREQKEMSP